MNKKRNLSTHRHGRTYYYVVGEGMYPAQSDLQSAPDEAKETLEVAYDLASPEHEAFRFCRMFPKQPQQPVKCSLEELGDAMDNTEESSNSDIPAGFTYLGQFIDHDITFDRQSNLDDKSQDPDLLKNSRSPFVDLDSVYGMGPDRSPRLYEDDKIHMRIGSTTGLNVSGLTQSMPNDLPRAGENDPDGIPLGEALIGDPRNDENLAVAQTHLAFLKFHNAVADKEFAHEANTIERFEKTRKVVTQHYQSVLLHDFLPRITDSTVYDDVMANGRKFYKHDDPQNPCMPVEFSVAAYRFGHSMIRNRYEWNRIFSSTGSEATGGTLLLLFQFSAVSGDLGGLPTLPTNWIIDWTRFYDFSDVAGINNNVLSNKTHLISPSLALGLSDLPEFKNEDEPHKRSLAIRNLLRGRLLNLPSGQDIAQAIGVTPLTPNEVKMGEHADILESNNFLEQTPLWYYILKEAQVQHGGQRLGQVGSRIVIETFHGLVEVSRHSILQEENWSPNLPATKESHYTMADLLAYVGDVNPLGN